MSLASKLGSSPNWPTQLWADLCQYWAFGTERVTLADCTYSQAEELGVGIRCRPVDWGSAVRAKGLDALVAAGGRLHIGFRDAGEEPETAFDCGNDHPEGGAGKRLAIGTMTNLDRFRIDFRFKG